MGIWKAFFNNTRKPEGLLGKCMVGSMPEMLDIPSNSDICEVVPR